MHISSCQADPPLWSEGCHFVVALTGNRKRGGEGWSLRERQGREAEFGKPGERGRKRPPSLVTAFEHHEACLLFL